MAMSDLQNNDSQEFNEDDLRVIREKHLDHYSNILRENWLRQVAARRIAIAALLVIAAGSLSTLIMHPENPPTWASSALFSILTAAIAFLFSDRKFDDDLDIKKKR